jgi:hypothetical protein
MSKGLAADLFLCFLALPLGRIFFVKSYHEAYRSSPAVFISITFLGMLSPLPGTVLLMNKEAT